MYLQDTSMGSKTSILCDAERAGPASLTYYLQNDVCLSRVCHSVLSSSFEKVCSQNGSSRPAETFTRPRYMFANVQHQVAVAVRFRVRAWRVRKGTRVIFPNISDLLLD